MTFKLLSLYIFFILNCWTLDWEQGIIKCAHRHSYLCCCCCVPVSSSRVICVHRREIKLTETDPPAGVRPSGGGVKVTSVSPWGLPVSSSSWSHLSLHKCVFLSTPPRHLSSAAAHTPLPALHQTEPAHFKQQPLTGGIFDRSSTLMWSSEDEPVQIGYDKHVFFITLHHMYHMVSQLPSFRWGTSPVPSWRFPGLPDVCSVPLNASLITIWQ